MDADGQHPVERIPEFVREWESGYEIVYNKRPEIHGASWWKKTTSKMFYKMFNAISEFKLEPRTTDYRLLDRAVVDAYLRFSEKNRMYRGLVDWL
jgi:dolichol-phosphate mannosyltransferase